MSKFHLPSYPSAPQPRTQRQSLGLIDRPRTESELMLRLAEGHAHDLVTLAKYSGATSPAQSDFLSKLSHEMRPPLVSILQMANVLRSKPLSPPAHAWVDSIRQSGEALLAMIDKLVAA